jgi:hypothetical protein
VKNTFNVVREIQLQTTVRPFLSIKIAFIKVTKTQKITSVCKDVEHVLKTQLSKEKGGEEEQEEEEKEKKRGEGRWRQARERRLLLRL